VGFNADKVTEAGIFLVYQHYRINQIRHPADMINNPQGYSHLLWFAQDDMTL